MEKGVSYHKYIILAVTVIIVVLIDQWIKHLIISKFEWGESIDIIKSIFAITYVRNTGAAFGLLHRAPDYFKQPFFIIVPLIALFVISFIFVKNKDTLVAFSLSLIIGGALGNLVDRMKLGFVVDFLDFHWKDFYHWPAFNVADSCIVIGVFLIFIQSLFLTRKPKTE